MIVRSWLRSGLLIVAALVMAACASPAASRSDASGGPAAGSSPTTAVPIASGTAGAETYCTSHGGMLVDRAATWNTNGDPPTWLRLAGSWTLCEFETGTGDEATRISVDLTTLSSPQPTLASLAYLSVVPSSAPPTPSQNPAAWYCANDLDATSAFGNTATPGGWVDETQPVFKVMQLCVFADGSAIDQFGLWYHANGTVRGADLKPLFAYQPGDKLPAVFQRRGIGS